MIKTISFEEAFRIINDCSAVIWGDMKMVTYPSYWTPEEADGDGDGQFMHLEGVDSDFNEYEVDFKSKDNVTVKVEGNMLIFVDTTGQEVEVTPLFSKTL